MKKLLTLITALTFVVLALPQSAQAVAPIGRWAKPVIEVYSPTPGGWGVNHAIAGWNEAGVVTLVRVEQPCVDCITIVEEVPVLEGYGHELAGLAQPYWSNGVAGVVGSCHLSLNPEYRETFSSFGITAHEMGHCLGLSHNDRKWSIMRDNGGDLFMGPTGRDLMRLAYLYGPNERTEG